MRTSQPQMRERQAQDFRTYQSHSGLAREHWVVASRRCTSAQPRVGQASSHTPTRTRQQGQIDFAACLGPRTFSPCSSGPSTRSGCEGFRAPSGPRGLRANIVGRTAIPASSEAHGYRKSGSLEPASSYGPSGAHLSAFPKFSRDRFDEARIYARRSCPRPSRTRPKPSG